MLNHNYGDGREMNYTFVGLARAAGFSAAEVYVAPRNMVFFLPAMMETSQISARTSFGYTPAPRSIIVDPAPTYFPFELLPWYETNTSGIRWARPATKSSRSRRR